MSSCVVLTPVSSFIVNTCDICLQTLEKHGYSVWRVPGFSAIDQARCQLASDALTQGFDETLWIDSDIGFDPDDVERLRSHNLPISCGIYPKKGKRELAIHAMPGTKEITFGKKGGLTEIRYAGCGFLHVRREVYETMQRKLELPVCNEHFGRPLIPFFQPMVTQTAHGPWYLAEDFAFCERARQCGFKIMADTRIRLHHYGSYGYSWEDAGAEPQRYGTYTYRVAEAQNLETAELFSKLRAKFPASRVFSDSPTPQVNDGSFRFLREMIVNSHIMLCINAVDEGLLASLPAIPHLTCILAGKLPDSLPNAWNTHSNRLALLPIPTSETLLTLHEHGISPDLILTSSSPTYDLLREELRLALDRFPDIPICGLTWQVPGVKDALRDEIASRGWKVETNRTAWRVKR